MFTLVIYDIPDDKLRNRIAIICKDYGLDHIQFSAFSGKLNWNRREELYQKLKKAAGRKEANIQIYVLCEKDLALTKKHVYIPELAHEA